ncbi:hypothetical protein GCM10023115_38500 [Pontixanthobacter gangjinensis]|uniref:T9SS type A sorting domain-containing protein n=1 Tax=Christiangramia aestuarii TaxID=1028746 RepID=A0A7M3SWN2_9FLAO|nr:MopE-related protein [Christiangramia aestuarii]MUP41013.1 T9SS type A sorting domain-containing protein [Christiangramia aestuarii]
MGKLYKFLIFFSILLIPLLGFELNAQATYTVTSTEDFPDFDLEDNLCADVNGNCTLRAAIENANKTKEPDNIFFNIPGEGIKTISLVENLPPITETILLDATTQPGYTWSTPKIVLSGKNLELIKWDQDQPRELIPQGFLLTGNSSGSSIKGFVIGGFGLLIEDNNGEVAEYYLGIGIQAVNSGSHTIQSNFIGVQADGLTPFQNAFGIIFGSEDGFNDSQNNLIGGNNPDEANVVGGSWRTSIFFGYKSGESEVRGNYVGIGIDGITTLNNRTGIGVSYPSYNNIIDGNLISGNNVGLHIIGKNNTVINNVVGLNKTKDLAVPNLYGIGITNTNNIIGEAGSKNLISGNDVAIHLYSESINSPAENNLIQYNFIGTDEDGIFSIPNREGLEIYGRGCYNNRISDNVISGNSGNGINIWNQANNNFIVSNYIGLNIGKDALGNKQSGIRIDGYDNKIGGESPDEQNYIAYNAKAISMVNSIKVTNNQISQNSVFNNGFGIDLGEDNITENDIRDADDGPNNLQNYPDLIVADFSSNLMNIELKFESDPAYSAYPIKIQLFKSDGNRQGKKYIGEFQLNESDLPKGKKSLVKSFELMADHQLNSGDLILSTATDANGNTSEFSAEIAVTGSEACIPEVFYADVDGDGLGDLANSIQECSAPEGFVSNSDDCDDTDAEIGALEVWYLDSDTDGYGDPSISIEDCLQPNGYVRDNTDCDDSNSLVFPGALDDSVDGIDQDCDGTDGPISACQGSDQLQVSEVCSTNSNVYWEITNLSSCNVDGRWELRKSSSTGASSGSFSLTPAESIEVVSGTISKGKTQIVVYWNDSNGLETSISQNASGIECSGAKTILSTATSDLIISPNPIADDRIRLFFTQPISAGILEVKIYSTSGNMVYQESREVPAPTNEITVEIDHSSWLEGVYILNAEINGVNHQIQFIK